MKFVYNLISILLFYEKHAIATEPNDVPKLTDIFDPDTQNDNSEQPNPYRYIVSGSSAAVNGGIGIKGMGRGNVTPLPGVRDAIVVEFDSESDAIEFMNNNSNDTRIEVDVPRFIQYADTTSDQRARKLAQNIPWGINNLFEDANGIPNVPDPSYFPVNTSHPICIIDSGIQLNHPDLPKDVSDADPSQESPFDIDICGHGTHVAGTVMAIDNDEGVIGVYPSAPGVKIMKIFGSNCLWTYSSSLVQAVANCVTSGSKIISMSIGGAQKSTYEETFFQRIYDDYDILSIAASGNDGDGSYLYPASYSSVMSVGATDIDDSLATFSQYNDQVDISAPGVDVLSTVNDGYSYMSGTSMATPHVSGLALLLWNKYPSCNNTDIRYAIESSAKDLDPPGRDNFFGNGLAKYWSADNHMSGEMCGTAAPSTPPTALATRPPSPSPTSPDLCSSDELPFVLNLQTDFHGEDISWSLEINTRGIYFDLVARNGMTYGNATSYQEELCILKNECFKFIIRDAAHDGLCCAHSYGHYSIYLNGERLKYSIYMNTGENEITPFGTGQQLCAVN